MHATRRSTFQRPRAGTFTTRRAWLATLLVLLAVAALPARGYAHGALRRSVPSNGAHLDAATRELRLTFTEDVELAFTRLSLTGPNGPVALGTPALVPDSAKVLIGSVDGPLVAGTYNVSWQVAGEDGHPVRGQFTFVIAPGAQGLTTASPAPVGPLAPGQGEPPPTHHNATSFPTSSGFDAESPLYSAVRWLTFLGLLGALGVVAFRGVLWGVRRLEPRFASTFVEPAAARAARLGLWMTLLLATAAALRLYAQSYALHGAGEALQPALISTMLSRTLWGWGWLLQAAATVVTAAGFALARRVASSPPLPAGGSRTAESVQALEAVPARAVDGDDTLLMSEQAPVAVPAAAAPDAPDARTHSGASRTGVEVPRAARSGLGWALAVFGALALSFTPALSGHAASVPRFAPLPIITDALHVIGAGGWLGGLLVVVLVGIPLALRLAPGDRGPAVAALINAFSPTALLFGGTVAATGVFAGWLHLGSVPALWESAYGRTLLLKLAILSVVFGTGAYNWLKVKPALGNEAAAGRLRRSATLELAVGAVVLAVTAVLVATATPMGTDMPPGDDETSTSMITPRRR